MLIHMDLPAGVVIVLRSFLAVLFLVLSYVRGYGLAMDATDATAVGGRQQAARIAMLIRETADYFGEQSDSVVILLMLGLTALLMMFVWSASRVPRRSSARRIPPQT